MTEYSVNHGTFVIDREFAAPPDRVFDAWADPDAKLRWFGSPDEVTDHYELDFRVGGREVARGRYEGSQYVYEAVYCDIVPEQRIIITYEMYHDGAQLSVSLVTVEFRPGGAGTLLTYTEQGAYLDGRDTPEGREHGTRVLFDALAHELEGAPTAA